MTATISGDGTSTLINLTTSGNTVLGDASTDTLNVGNGGLVKDASGNVGIGTISPVGKLTVSKAGAEGIEFIPGGTSNVSTTQYYNRSGAAYTANAQDASYHSWLISGAEKARITSAGNLLVNATSAVSNADEAIGAVSLSSTGAAATFKNSAGATASTVYMWNAATTGNNLFAYFVTETTFTPRGTISYNRGAGLVAYNTTSDYRAKTVNGLVQNALSKVALLKPSTGRMNGAEQDIDFFVAHELQEVVPSAVTGDKDAVNEDGSPNYQMVDKSALIPLLTAAIQEQQAIITQLQADVAALKAQGINNG